jgi:hypothetical protein
MAKHTPTPWQVQTTGNCPGLVVETDGPDNPVTVADCIGDDLVSPDECRANAEFIALACNAHDDLLAACKAMLKRMEVAYDARVKLTGIAGGGIGKEIEQAEAAIAKAETGATP